MLSNPLISSIWAQEPDVARGIGNFNQRYGAGDQAQVGLLVRTESFGSDRPQRSSLPPFMRASTHKLRVLSAEKLGDPTKVADAIMAAIRAVMGTS